MDADAGFEERWPRRIRGAACRCAPSGGREANRLARTRHVFHANPHPEFPCERSRPELTRLQRKQRCEVAVVVAVPAGAAIEREVDLARCLGRAPEDVLIVLHIGHEVPLGEVDLIAGGIGECEPPANVSIFDRAGGGEDAAVRGGEVVDRESDLLQAVLVARPIRSRSRLLHRRQQQPDEDRNNRDHHEEFDQSKGSATHGEASG